MSIISPLCKKISSAFSIVLLIVILSYPVLYAENYFWDTDSSDGYQAGNGVWTTTTNSWTTDGNNLSMWPGTGNSATFTGEIGTYLVTVSQDRALEVDSIHFGCSGYTIRGDSIRLCNQSSITVGSGVKATVSVEITGSTGLTISGDKSSDELYLTGLNSYTGVTKIGPDIRLNIVTLTDGGSKCAIGAADNSAAHIIFDGGKMRFIGTGTSTDRLFTIMGNTKNCIYSSGIGGMVFSNTGMIQFEDTGNCVLEFGGTYSGSNTFAPLLGDPTRGTTSVVLTGLNTNTWIFVADNTYSGTTTVVSGILQVGNNGPTGAIAGDIVNNSTTCFCRSGNYSYDGILNGTGTLVKAGSGSLTLTATSSYSGPIIVSDGTLLVSGSLKSEGPVSVLKNAAIGGDGFCNGMVSVFSGGNVAPGRSGIGTFAIDQLVMEPASILTIDIGTNQNDTLMLTGTKNHALCQTITINAPGVLRIGTYRIINYSGILTGNSPENVIGPPGYRYTVTSKNNYINLDVSRMAHVIKRQTNDTLLVAGDTAVLSVTTEDDHYSYTWIAVGNEDDTLSDSMRLVLPGVTIRDSGSSYLCYITDSIGTSVSDTITIRVVIPPTVTAQPGSQTVYMNDTVQFTVMATGSPPLSYQWYKRDGGKDIPVASTLPMLIDNVSDADEGEYYCIVSNDGGRDTSKTFTLAVEHPDEKKRLQRNSITIDTLYFDTVTGSVGMSWCFDSSVVKENAEVGIMYSLSPYPAAEKGWKVVKPDEACIDTMIHLHSLQFDTLYYVSLWLRLNKGKWLEPTASARDSVRSSHTSRQIITLFDTAEVNDTISVFDGSVLFWIDSGFSDMTPYIDTVKVIELEKPPQGMIIVGKPFRFENVNSVQPFLIGMIIDTLPAGRSISDVRMYTENSGEYTVNYGTVIDQNSNIVYIRTGDLRRPFITMIDTMTPKIEFFSDTGIYLAPSEYPSDSLRIADNVANVVFEYLYGKGDQLTLFRQCSKSYRTGDHILLSISDAQKVSCSETGYRAFLIVHDGCNSDTINMSRCVGRSESDIITAEANRWTPVYATAELIDKSGGALVAWSPPDADGYDNRYLRIYRWVNYTGNLKNSDKWVEYNPDDSGICSLFTLDPGRIFWVKTRENVTFHLDSGYTLSLKDPFTIDLPPHEWSDLGMPYRFSVRMEEILSATGSEADSLLFFQWIKDGSSNLYSLDPLYVPGMVDKEDKLVTLDYRQGGGYSCYNQCLKTVRLRIPPTLPAMAAKLDKKAVKGSLVRCGPAWSTKFMAQANNTHKLPAVYFGYAPGVVRSDYPVSPSFSKFRQSVFDRRTSACYGHYICSDAKNGLVKELLITNGTDSTQTIDYHFEPIGAFPANYTTHCFDAAEKKFDTSGTFSVAAHAVTSRWIIIGDAAFRQEFIASALSPHYKLHMIFPNPARSAVTIQYEIPFGALEWCTIGIYNVLGERVWNKHIDKLPTQGLHSVTWNCRDTYGGATASGIYIVRFTVMNKGGKPVKRLEQRFTLLK